MFSVGATPFNSRKRQLYGGWASGVNKESTEQAAVKAWEDSPAQFVRDTKWASMAEKYAFDPDDRDNALRIRGFSKGFLSAKRAAAKSGDGAALSWLSGYNSANRLIRSPYKLSSLSPTAKDAIWAKFQGLPWNPDGLADADRMFLQLANRAPFGSAPALPRGVDVPLMDEFVDEELNYYRPGKLSSGTRRLLGQARRGNVILSSESNLALRNQAKAAALAAYQAAKAGGGSDQLAYTIAQQAAGANYAQYVARWLQGGD